MSRFGTIQRNWSIWRYLAVTMAVFQVVLVVMLSWHQAPVSDEAAHLTAGHYIWETGAFDLYPVNPPLIKFAATWPVLQLKLKTNWTELRRLGHDPGDRREWSASVAFFRDNAQQVRWAMFLARLTILPWVILGTLVCWSWSRELYGERAACLAVGLWCFSPSVLCWGATILPDLPAAASGIAAAYAFRRWLKCPSWNSTLVAGLALGIAELTKMTWLILFVLWPCLWLVIRVVVAGRQNWALEFRQIVVIMLLGLMVINVGYGYQGTGEDLGSFTFVSNSLAGAESIAAGRSGGNRFNIPIWKSIPVPVPRDYCLGIDLQKLDFERGLLSYLGGEWSTKGWWYYYLVCCALKVPLGTWIIVGLACCVTVKQMRVSQKDSLESCGRTWRIAQEQSLLLIPALCLLLLVSSQTGINRHFRYLLPAFPFVGVFASQSANISSFRFSLLVWGALLCNVSGTLSEFPHMMAYFNVLGGGAEGGREYLLDSNLDWGQDVWDLADWCQAHPEAAPLYFACRNSYSLELIQSHLSQSESRAAKLFQVVPLDRAESSSNPIVPPSDGPASSLNLAGTDSGIAPGWYAVSVHRMYERGSPFAIFRSMRRNGTIGNTIDLFHVPENSSPGRTRLHSVSVNERIKP